MAKKGNTPWNKGLTKETDDRVQKYSNSGKDKKGEASARRHEANRKKNGLSLDPSTWTLVCSFEECDNILQYSSYQTYLNAIRATKNGSPPRCTKCRCKNRNVSVETKKKMSNSAKTRKTTPEQEKIRAEKISTFHKERYATMTSEERAELNKKIIIGQWDKPKEEIDSWMEKKSNARKEEMWRLGQLDKFAPSFNVNTIPYIEDILNIKYDTKFQHALTEGGEFHIYDKKRKKFYYADAYSKELNIWIEFDEERHFDILGNLKEECQTRENRIKELLDPMFLRIHFDKKIYS